MLTINFTPGLEHAPLTYNNATSTFSGEASCLRINQFFKKGDRVVVNNTKNNIKITFEFSYADMDGSNEDTYGWNFKSVSGAKFPCKLLIIND